MDNAKLAIIATSITVCLILLLVPGSMLESDAGVEHMVAGPAAGTSVPEAPLVASLKTRISDLEHTMSKMTGMDVRVANHRDGIRALHSKLTSFIAGQASSTPAQAPAQTLSEAPGLQATALASVLPADGQVFPATATQPSVWMDGSSYVYGVWMDKTGNGNNARCSLGVRTATQQPGEAGVNTSFVYVRGGTEDAMEVVRGWPAEEYTFVHVTRYDGEARNRIWNQKGATMNWLSGHHAGVAGRVHHNTWVVKQPEPAPKPGDWLVVVDTLNTARVNMGKYVGEITGGVNPGGAAINQFAGKHLELSDWAAAEVIVFEGILSSADVLKIEQYLHAKYGITAFAAPAGVP